MLEQEDDNGQGQTRLMQMDANLDYRLKRLEEELLPKRVSEVEFTVKQMQAEITAIKEISRGIGIKVDSGIESLRSGLQMDVQGLKNEQLRNQAFIKGVLWVAGGIAAVFGLAPSLLEIVKKMAGV